MYTEIIENEESAKTEAESRIAEIDAQISANYSDEIFAKIKPFLSLVEEKERLEQKIVICSEQVSKLKEVETVFNEKQKV